MASIISFSCSFVHIHVVFFELVEFLCRPVVYVDNSAASCFLGDCCRDTMTHLTDRHLDLLLTPDTTFDLCLTISSDQSCHA